MPQELSVGTIAKVMSMIANGSNFEEISRCTGLSARSTDEVIGLVATEFKITVELSAGCLRISDDTKAEYLRSLEFRFTSSVCFMTPTQRKTIFDDLNSQTGLSRITIYDATKWEEDVIESFAKFLIDSQLAELQDESREFDYDYDGTNLIASKMIIH